MAENKKISLRKIWKYILGMKVEFIFLCYFAPGSINTIGLELLPIEKACRNDLNYSNDVCSNLNTAEYKGLCSDVYDFQGTLSDDDLNATDSTNSFLSNLTLAHTDLNINFDILIDICTAERDAQAIKLEIETNRASLKYLSLIVIIFAGPLGDKYNQRKPFLLLPMIGELLSVLAYLTTSIFKSSVPTAFHLYLETILNSICGGFSLMLMGVFSILAATTAEEDRTFRFGVFTAFFSGVGIILAPLAPYVFEFMGYVNMFLLCVLIHVVGIIYIIFFFEEVPKAATVETSVETENVKSENGLDNPAFTTSEGMSSASTLEKGSEINPNEMVPKAVQETTVAATIPKETQKSFFRESFEMFLSNFKVFTVARPFSGRFIMWLVMIGFAIYAFSNTDTLLLGNFGRLAWGWTTEFALYSSFNQAIGFIGTLIVTGVFVNTFKLADSLLVIIAVFCRLVSRILYVYSKDTGIIYLAGGIDMFNSAPVVAIRSVLSKIVALDELGRLYTVISVVETVIGPLSIQAYVDILTRTLETAPETYYYLTIVLLVLVILLFTQIYTLVKKFLKGAEETSQQKSDQNENIEISKL